jgi:hypothetical protein
MLQSMNNFVVLDVLKVTRDESMSWLSEVGGFRN